MKKRNRLLALGMAAMMAFWCIGCGGSAEPASQSETSDVSTESEALEGTGEAAETGEAAALPGASMTVVETTDLTSIDPLDAGSEIIGTNVALVYAGLYTLDESGDAVLDLAESVEKSDDLLTWTFTLKDAKWSNGDPITAYDYEYSWKRVVDVNNYDGSDPSSYPTNAGIKNAEAIAAGEMDPSELGCHAEDDKTFVVE